MKFKYTHFLLNLLIVSGFCLVHFNRANASQNFSTEQKQEMETIIHDYLVTKPEVLVEVSEALQKKQQQEMVSKAQKAIPENAKDLFYSNSPFVGNKNGNIYIVKFFDFQCHPCRHMHVIINKLVANNPNIKVIYKVLPLPFFGEASQYAAKLSLAAFKQGKYKELHAKLMEVKLPLKTEAMQGIAKSLKLDMNKLAVDIKDKSVTEEITNNFKLAERIGLMGTPAIIVANDKEGTEFKSFYSPGVVDYDALDNLVKQASGQSVAAKPTEADKK